MRDEAVTPHGSFPGTLEKGNAHLELSLVTGFC